jgi:hypothetical protein
MSQLDDNWFDDNQRYLLAALEEVKSALDSHCDQAGTGTAATDRAHDQPHESEPNPLSEPDSTWNRPPQIETLSRVFGLSPFEQAVVLLCAGVELDASFVPLLAKANGDARFAFPTFSLALAALPQAPWSALAPTGPLRYRRLVAVDRGASLTTSPLRIDERVLHYLTGVEHLDEALLGLVEPIAEPDILVDSHRQLVERIVGSWTQAAGRAALPVIQLCGAERTSQQAVAAAACSRLGLALLSMSAQVIPSDPRELDNLTRLWQREAALSGSALLVDCHEADGADLPRQWAIARLIENSGGAVVVACRERRSLPSKTSVTLEVRPPTTGEQRGLWQSALGERAAQLNGQVERLISQFQLPPPSIQAAGAEALGRLAEDDDSDRCDETVSETGLADSPAPALGSLLWDVCRAQARPRLDDLAGRIDPVATWDDLVLPEPQLDTCLEIAMHVRQRMKVYDNWGFAAKSSRGLGVSALFAGPSGTGKTMAAEVLANELQLDVYRIDLSQVVSKYIGETEKNLRRLFDAAERGGAILLFDEADALFGKRGEVKDSHDRYANIEVSYLLQRMETYRGLAILTTNMKSALDTAFLRRIRFVVQFPFPDAPQRRQIWCRIFPQQTPCDGLDMDKLARLNVAGGNIRNIALHAAFLAADHDEPVRMPHLLRAARVEYAKLEKPLTEAEIGGWV